MPRLQLRACLLVLPAAAVFTSLFIAPFVYFFLVSFWRFQSYALVRDFTADNYREVFSTYLWLGLYTLMMAAIIASAALILGFIYAYIARFKAGHFGSVLVFLALVTLFGGYLMKIYAWRTILGTEGIINNTLLASGLVTQPITWLLYNPPAVVITLTHFLFPFAMLPVYAAMRGIADSEIEAARDLGASRLRILMDHIIPRSRAGIVAGFVLAFLIACGDWVTPVLVGGRMTMLGNLIAAQFGEFLNWPLGAAMAFSLLVASVGVIGAFTLASRIAEPR